MGVGETRLMTTHEASRTLVKSHPELWAQCSDAASLARHLDRFGEIRITRLEPETAVAWEGERASGTVRLEPSGWGTRVILTATAVQAEAGEATGVQEENADMAAEPVPAPPRPGLLARWIGRLRGAGVAPSRLLAKPSVSAAPREAAPPPAPALVGALDSLGRAHHRPYSHG